MRPRVEGTEAVEAYTISLNEGEPYDIILLDIAMPEVDGIQVLDTVRSMESKRGVLVGEGIPVIMVTAFKEHFMKAFNKGCDDYILKPFDAATVIEKISAVLAGRHTAQLRA